VSRFRVAVLARMIMPSLPSLGSRHVVHHPDSTPIVRDVGHLVRVTLQTTHGETEVVLVQEPNADIEAPPPPLEGVVVESLTDLRSNKLTCILSRSEPRDLVDLLFLDRAGYPPERDLELALRKDSGIDPLVS
jgi:hypothetical protein